MTTRPMTLVLATLAWGAGACETNPTPEPAKTEAKAESAKAEAKADAKAEAKADVSAEAKADAKAEAKADAKAEPAEPTTPVTPPEAVAEPPKAAGLVPSPLPRVEDETKPAVVFAALPDGDPKEWKVDIVDFSGMSMKRLEKKLQADLDAEWKRKSGEGGGDEEEEGKEPPNLLATKAGKAYIPAGFAVGDPWTLVTTRGVEHRTAKGFEAVLMEGSAQVHFYVQLGSVPEGIEELEPTLAFRGDLPTTAKLVVPKPQAPVDAGPNVLDDIVALYTKKAGSDGPPLSEVAPFTQKDVKLYAGRFPDNRTHAAFLYTDRGDEVMPRSALFFVKADASVELVVIPDVLGQVELVGLLDVDGDGFDELFYEDSYHEGWYAMMMQWEGDTPKPRTLTGDGI